MSRASCFGALSAESQDKKNNCCCQVSRERNQEKDRPLGVPNDKPTNANPPSFEEDQQYPQKRK